MQNQIEQNNNNKTMTVSWIVILNILYFIYYILSAPSFLEYEIKTNQINEESCTLW